MTHQRGFSILEIVIALSIMSVLFVLLSNITFDSLRNFRTQRAKSELSDRANRVTATMLHDLREAQPSPSGAYPIISATDTSVSFYASIGAPGIIQQIRYFLNGTDLGQGIIAPVGNPVTYPAGNEVVNTILTNVRNTGPLFQYYDTSYTGTQAAMNPIVPADIRLIGITIVHDQDLGQPPAATTITVQAHLRNLKDNY